MKRFLTLLLALSLLLCVFARADEIDLSVLDRTYLRYNNFDGRITFMTTQNYESLLEALPEDGIIDLNTLDPEIARFAAARVTNAARALIADAAQANDSFSPDNIASVGFIFSSVYPYALVQSLFVTMADGTYVILTVDNEVLRFGPEEALDDILRYDAKFEDGHIVPCWNDEYYVEIPAELFNEVMAEPLPGPTYEIPEGFTFDAEGMELLVFTAFELNGLTVDTDSFFITAYDDKDHLILPGKAGYMDGDTYVFTYYQLNFGGGFGVYYAYLPDDPDDTIALQRTYDTMVNRIGEYVATDMDEYYAMMEAQYAQ